MKYKVIVAPSAISDVQRIIAYISDELMNKTAAETHLRAFVDALDSLEDMPLRNRVLSELSTEKHEIRLAPVKHYFLLYEVVEDEVHVLRAVYSRRDMTQIDI